MKCTSCNYESEQDFAVCPTCGAAQTVTEARPVVTNLLNALKDNLFLAMCILVSVSCLYSLTSGGLPLLGILATVFLWLVFAKSRKDIADSEHLRCVSGTVYAAYVINSVVFWLYVGLAIIATLLFCFVISGPVAFDVYDDIILDGLSVMQSFPLISRLLPAAWISTVILFVLTAISILINTIGLRNIHRFVKSVYKSVQSADAQIEFAQTAKKWLTVLAVIEAVLAVSSVTSLNMTSFISRGCISAVMFIAAALIGKYFLTSEE